MKERRTRKGSEEIELRRKDEREAGEESAEYVDEEEEEGNSYHCFVFVDFDICSSFVR